MRRRLLAVSLAGSLILSACSGGHRNGASSHTSPLDDVYASMAHAMSRPDQVFRTVMVEETAQGENRYRKRTEASIDLEAGAARSDVETVFGVGEAHRATWLVNGDAWYQTQEDGTPRKREAPRCHGAPGAALAVILNCHSFFEASATRIDAHTMFEARPAIALITSGADTGAGEATGFSDTLYLDAATYLPVALEGGGTIQHGVAIPVRTTVRYENSFVPRESLDPAMFAPASIGYAERDVLAGLGPAAAGIEVTWPGRDVDMPDGLPALTLRQATVQPPALQQLVGYRATLSYGRADDEFALPEITLREWRAGEWSPDTARATGEWWAAPCVEETAIADGAAVYAASACGPDAGRYAARARIGATIVLIEAREGSPYKTAAAMKAIVAALQAY